MSHPVAGFGAVLSNRHFHALWLAQLMAQTSQHAIHFIQMVLVEKLTGSATLLGITILAFTIPGILFSPIAGVVVDRHPKKWILVGSMSIRVFFALSYIPILSQLEGAWRLIAIYVITFLTATVAQFFTPAEGASIPLLVGEKHLLAANSLFTLTMGAAQILGLMVLGPLSISLLRIEGGFVVVAILYLIAAVSVSTLPMDKPAARDVVAVSPWRQLGADSRRPAIRQRATAHPGRSRTVGNHRHVDHGHGNACAWLRDARVGHVRRRCRDCLCAGRRRHAVGDRRDRPVGACLTSRWLWLPGADPDRDSLCRHGLNGAWL